MLYFYKKFWCFNKKECRIYPEMYCNMCFSKISHLYQFQCGHNMCIRCLHIISNKNVCEICVKNVFYDNEDKKR